MSSSSVPLIHAAAENFEIIREGSLVRVRVWRRPDLDSSRGAQLAERLSELLCALAAPGVTLLLDVREAPPVQGERTVGALRQILGTFGAAGCKVALLTGESAITQLQLRRIVEESARDTGRVFVAIEAAISWLRLTAA